jgi:hypothetical protein
LPIARFGVYLSVGVQAIAAVHECVANGRCLPDQGEDRGECADYREDGPYFFHDFILGTAGKLATGKIRTRWHDALGIRAGNPYAKWQKELIYEANQAANGVKDGNKVYDDVTGEELSRAKGKDDLGKGSRSGTATVDHRCPRNSGGRNSFGNACVRRTDGAEGNSRLRDTMKPRSYCSWQSVTLGRMERMVGHYRRYLNKYYLSP